MCGFAGYVTSSPGPSSAVLQAMGERLKHRGPDEQGVWQEGPVGLVHRRLSIQDLSPAGAQPMISTSNRFVIAFNGEVYNFLDLRKALESEGVRFRGHSDTEVMLSAIEKQGFEEAIKSFSGMFAFTLLDRRERRLYLVRDRMGEKPLYYGWQDGAFLFGSELKPLRCHPEWRGEIDRDALTLLLRHNLIPAPHTVYRGIRKLPPASFVTLDLNAEELSGPVRYWSLAECFTSLPGMSQDEAADHLESLLQTVVSEQMISDVPLGAFLSGGVDSSTVVALMQQAASRPVKTFSIGFREEGYNEAEHARAVAEHLGTEHTELYVSPEDALETIPRLPEIYDEPFADSSQIPTFLVSRMTRRYVTVALSGDGGDELFCGYTRYPETIWAWNKRNGWPAWRRRLLDAIPPEYAAPLVKGLLPGQRQRALVSIADRIREERFRGRARDLQSYYRARVSYWPEPCSVVRRAREPGYALTQEIPEAVGEDPLKRLMWLDLNWYLPDDILTKVDRAAMANSLETRIPFLDRRIVEYVLGLPSGMNMQNGKGKLLLRRILYKYVPSELIERPKQGFAVPLGSWLRTSLREWGEELLSAKRLGEQGLFHAKPVRRLWQAHQAGADDHSFRLWGILMFQAWLDRGERG
jgi:asparagine synthase (glutamine-hydrolysing)